MKFYDCATAPSPRRVRIFAAEKGMVLDSVQVDLANGEQFGDAFRKINPDCMVPALELDDGTLLSEVVAICQYLEELHPEPALLGQTPVERAIIAMWNIKIEQQGIMAIAEAFRNSTKGRAGPVPARASGALSVHHACDPMVCLSASAWHADAASRVAATSFVDSSAAGLPTARFSTAAPPQTRALQESSARAAQTELAILRPGFPCGKLHNDPRFPQDQFHLSISHCERLRPDGQGVGCE